MSKTAKPGQCIADIYSPSGHLGATLHEGAVTVTVRNAVGDHAAVTFSLPAWCSLLEQARSQLHESRAAPRVHLNASAIEIADHSPAPPPRKPGMAE